MHHDPYESYSPQYGDVGKTRLRVKTPPCPQARAQTLLVQAQSFLETAHAEVYAVDNAMTNLRHAMDAFQILFDKQIHLCADSDGFKVARVKADLMDVIESLKTSASTIEATSNRMQKTIATTKRTVHHAAVQRPARGKTLPPMEKADLAIEPRPTLLTLFEILSRIHDMKESTAAIIERVAGQTRQELGKKDVLLCFRDLLLSSLVKNPVLTPTEKSTNKVHTTRYASILTAAAWDEWSRLQWIHDDGIEIVAMEAYVCSPDFLHLVQVVSGKLSVQPPTSPPTSPLELNAAEQTLSMAKLLHDLANAESEAKNGFKLSVRTNMSRSKEFSKAFLNASKELLDKDATLY
ncbi:hypothetical protein AC1031_011468 [Aphanomyces cochlioides]|nr:hypothetical protein AC1031_011468 [Aphanomyces cochlioides]